MTFAQLSTSAVLAGAVGLAAMLFALQRLRTQYRDVTVVTTIFWRRVVEEAPARTFWERFRHVWAYVLVLAICSLIWIGFAEPTIDRNENRPFYVLILDGSAGMAAGRRFQDAVRDLERHLSRLPSEQREVVWSGAQPRTLLRPGEHESLLEKRLESLAPEPAPSRLERLLRQLAATARGQQPTSVLVFGDAPVRKTILDLMPSTVSVKRAAAPAPLHRNAGFTALGVANAASGAWDRVDVLVQVDGTTDRRPISFRDVEFDLDGGSVSSAAVTPSTDDGGEGWLIRDLPATGGLFTATLRSADALPLDDIARVRLPRKPLLRVLLSPSVASVLVPALRADRGVWLVEDAPADVVIRRAGELFGGQLPALEFTRAATQSPAFLFTHPATLDSTAVFNDAVKAMGLAEIDGMSLANVAQRPIEASITAGSQWQVSVWEELLSEDYNFTQSRSFPSFVANAVRWLAGTRAWYPYAAAGLPLRTTEPGERRQVLASSGRVLDPLGVDFIPALAGELTFDSASEPLSVALLDSDVTTGRADSALEVADVAQLDAAPLHALGAWCIAIAIGLLGVEWYLVQTNRMP